MTNKATLVGINSYPSPNELKCCIADAEAVAGLLERNGNGDRNFDTRLYGDVRSRNDLRRIIYEAFMEDDDIALFYFSGHGGRDEFNTYLVTPDYKTHDPGISVNDLLTIANTGKARNRVIILDCCHSGAAGVPNGLGGTASYINKGVTILAASKATQKAIEVNGHGIFTNLLIGALKGGAADINGHITLASIYAYIDNSLGAFAQRPVFKTNITSFVPIRTVKPKVSPDVLRLIASYFPQPDYEYQLNPSYEFTNMPGREQQIVTPFADESNSKIFKHLQQFQGAGLVEPIDETHMYFAAMEGKSCRLTPLGQHYWYLATHR